MIESSEPSPDTRRRDEVPCARVIRCRFVAAAVLALPDADREMLAAELLPSLDGPERQYSPAKADAWARKVERRIERFVGGESEGIDLATAQQQVRAALADG